MKKQYKICSITVVEMNVEDVISTSLGGVTNLSKNNLFGENWWEAPSEEGMES